jgi:RNA polymerase sigma-70 factor (ECF subfamily)
MSGGCRSQRTDFDIEGLVAAAQAGDGVAFAGIYEYFAPRIARYLDRNLPNRPDEVDDLTAEVFYKVFEKMDRFEFRGLPFSAWVYRIAHNRLVDHVRFMKRAATTSIEADPRAATLQAPCDLHESLDRDEVTRALRRLTHERREVLVRRFVDGLSIAETARALGKTEEATKKLQLRALGDLRRDMGAFQLAGLAS